MKSLFRSNYFVMAALMIAALAVSALIFAQQKKTDDAASCPMTKNMANMSHDNCPMMKNGPSTGMNHDEMVMKNGEKEMGFSQTDTTHHFIISKNGGAIRITTNDPKDADNRDKIRQHLKIIAEQFKNGIFTTPFAIHGQVPPGVREMDKLKAEVNYSYAETENGAEVRIVTANPDALYAIHDFLKFQISEHKTGDPVDQEN